MYLKKYHRRTNVKYIRSDQSSVWTKKQPRMENQLPAHVLAFKDKGYLYILKNISRAARDKLSKSSPKHIFLPGTRKEQKQQTAWCVYCH